MGHLIKRLFHLVVLLCGTLAAWPAGAGDGAASLALTCYTCHSGRAADDGGIPPLETLSRDELVRRLKAFRDGTGDATVMDRISTAYSDEEIEMIGRYISGGRQGR